MTRVLCRLASTAALVALTACGGHDEGGYSGYVEGEYVRVASPFAGELTSLQVQRGAQVVTGAPLFALERENEAAGRAEAQARVRRAQSQLANLQKGRRPEELDASRAELAQAEAVLKLAAVDLKRAQELEASGFISAAKVDEARAAEQRERARVKQLQANLAVAKLAARPDEIAAAAAEVKASQDALAQADWRLEQKSQQAPVAGLVADTLYQQGEWVPAGAPVVSLLPPGNVKVRFFVPESQLGALRVGQGVRIACDGCGAPVGANVSFIAPQPEYTPPVIYSKENRQKLVFMIEARPAAADGARLHPGQPVQIQLVDANKIAEAAK